MVNSTDDSKSTKRIPRFGTNDPAWYRHYDTLAKDVSSLFMSRPNGLDYPDRLLPAATSNPPVSPTALALCKRQGGILTLNVVPSFGGSYLNQPAGSALNIAAGKLYYYVVHANSRNVSYDKSDLMKCLMGYDSLQCVIADAIRAYKFIKAVDPQNRWYKAIVTRLGWDADDLLANVVRFRAAINFAIQRFNQISIPNVFDIFKAHKHMYDYVYVDRPGVKAQYIAPVLTGFWFYNDEKSSVDWISKYTWNNRPVDYNEARKVADFENTVNFLLHTLYDSTDMGVMQGDIRKAFSSNEMLTMYMVEEDNEVPLMYDSKEFLLKLHNMEFSCKCKEGPERVLTTDTLSYIPKMTYRDTDIMDGNIQFVMYSPDEEDADVGTFVNRNHLMDLPDDLNGDVDSVIQMQLFKATRMWNYRNKFYPTDADGETIIGITGETGPFMIQDAKWFYNLEDALKPSSQNSDFLYLQRRNYWKRQPIQGENVPFNLLKYITLSQLAVTLPLNVWVANNGTGTVPANHAMPIPMMWEVENVTEYSDDILRNIHRVCIESLYFAPELYNGQSR